MPDLVLENDFLRAVFDSKTGSLLSLVSKTTGWPIQRRSELGLSFEMLVPVPDRRYNRVLGLKQPLADFEQEGNRLVLSWNNLRSEFGGILDISFQGVIMLGDDGLEFEGQIDNRTPYSVETVSWPCLGDLSPPPGENRLDRLSVMYGGAAKASLFPVFNNEFGYFGVDYPTQKVATPYTQFVLVQSDSQGLYAGYHDTTAEHLVQFAFELKPGYEYGDCLSWGVVPVAESISGKPVRIEFSAIHFPFFTKEFGRLHPVVLRPYEGTWHKGADCYKNWRKTWYTPPRIPPWTREVHSWQQIHINSAEETYRFPYKDLVKYGEDCAKHGVAAIQLTGWNKGGQDRGNPSHDIEPALGTWDDLHGAIAACHKMGVRIVLFNKYTWADKSTEEFRAKLVRLAAKDPYGDCQQYEGYMYDTPTQLANINTRRFAVMCMNSAEWRSVACSEFAKVVALEPAGMLYDENEHHGRAHYCFDPGHGHHVPAHIFAGDGPIAERFRKLAVERGADMLFAGEGNYDTQFIHYGLSYFRITFDHIPMHRYVAPDDQMMIGVIGHNDRNMINMALLYRYVVSYEPRNFKGRLDEFPLTMEYGKKVDELRRRYSDYLWNAECRDTVGACVTVPQGRPAPRYSVFCNLRSGKRAVVVANLDPTAPITAEVRLDEPNGPLVLATPEAPDACDSDGSVTVPPFSAAVLMER